MKTFINILKKFYWDIRTKLGRDTYIAWLIKDIPGECGIEIRKIWYGKKLKKAGENLLIQPGTVIVNPQNIEVGDNVSIGISSMIQAGGGLVVKSNAMFGPYVKIWTQNHLYEDPNKPINLQGYQFNPVEIGEDVWIGANAFIMPGAKIGDKCIISASSVVGGKIYPDRLILAGNPARKIGVRGGQHPTEHSTSGEDNGIKDGGRE